MKRKIFRCLLCAFYLTATVFPVAVLLAGLAEGSILPAMLAFALAAVGGSVLSVFVKERRALWTIAVIAAVCAGSVLLLPYDGWNYVCAIGCGVIVPVGVCRDREENALIDVRLMIAGLFCAGLSYFIAMLNLIDWVKPVIGYGAYVYLMLSLLLLNRSAVRQAAGGQARRMMRGNQGLTLVFAVAMTIVVFIAPLQHAVANGLRWLIASFFNLFAGGNASDGIVSGGEQAGQMDLSALGGEERVMPEWLQTLSTIVLTVVAVAAVLALLCALLLAGGAFGYVTLDGKLQEKQAEIDRLQEKTAFFDRNAVCVNDDGSMLYHRYGCARLEPDQCRIYSRKTAEAGGYEPCPDCFGS